MAPEAGDASFETVAGAAGATSDDADDNAAIAATDGRTPGRRGLATRSRLLECTAELLATTPWRSIKVIDIARQAGTSPATFYQYFENVEQAILIMAEELMQGAGTLAELVDGDWSEDVSWTTARRVVEGFMAYWEANRAVFRVVELATEEGDLRFQGLRVRALNAVTVTLARVIASGGPARSPAGADPMAVAATLISMLAHVAAHRYGFEFWGIRTSAMVESQARVLHWAVTGRPAPDDPGARPVAAPRTGPVVGGGAAQVRNAQARRRPEGEPPTRLPPPRT
jgi:AcrR family transcriptional regulator